MIQKIVGVGVCQIMKTELTRIGLLTYQFVGLLVIVVVQIFDNLTGMHQFEETMVNVVWDDFLELNHVVFFCEG